MEDKANKRDDSRIKKEKEIRKTKRSLSNSLTFNFCLLIKRHKPKETTK